LKRSAKGAALTHQEMDANWQELLNLQTGTPNTGPFTVGALTSNSHTVNPTGRQFQSGTINGSVLLKMAAGDLTWACGYRFDAYSTATALGGLFGLGSDKDSITYLTLGAAYTDTKFRLMMSTGHALFGTSSDNTTSGNANLQTSNGIYLGNSANSAANVLDWYEEGTWTPSVTFVTPGDLNIVLATGAGSYTRIGNKIICRFYISTSTFTHTTASGDLRVNGLPFVVGGISAAGGGMRFNNFTKAGYTQFVPEAIPGVSYLRVACGGSGVGVQQLTAADTPSGGTLVLIGTIIYSV